MDVFSQFEVAAIESYHSAGYGYVDIGEPSILGCFGNRPHGVRW
ncbi:hypothetical protein DLNHIDIE_00347 [Acidithiobacillus thiooxidans ATCC 19377]|uniref:Uncharacterized protein n=1 Tax=Acidithiobacillus thiooxidans ATCC 19377 TaxID=637390 RepID=A0A543Q2D8_ACITH|nr:hypothetical protein DLNHIDIE_00347 [Acidithiobacillus thiooxidans ATCC 19377]